MSDPRLVRIRRSELRDAYFAAPPRWDGMTFTKGGREFRTPSRHAGLDAVVALIAERAGIEIGLMDDGVEF